jgi:fumarate hydratase subunit beta
MAEEIRITTPLAESVVLRFKAGDSVKISGNLYTGRDAAHKRLYELIKDGKELPFPLAGHIIYYVGPAPAKQVMPAVLLVQPPAIVWILIPLLC